MQMLSLQFYLKSSVCHFLHWSVGLTVYNNPLNSVTSRNRRTWLYDVSQTSGSRKKSHFFPFFGKYNSCMKRRLPYVWKYVWTRRLNPLNLLCCWHKITYSDSSILHMHINVFQERLEKTKKKTKTKTKTFRPHEILKSVHKMRKHS